MRVWMIAIVVTLIRLLTFQSSLVVSVYYVVYHLNKTNRKVGGKTTTSREWDDADEPRRDWSQRVVPDTVYITSRILYTVLPYGSRRRCYILTHTWPHPLPAAPGCSRLHMDKKTKGRINNTLYGLLCTGDWGCHWRPVSSWGVDWCKVANHANLTV